MYIVGLSAFYHDSACCLIQNGEIVAAAAEERFSRRKHDPRLPTAAFRYCLQAGGIDITQIDAIAFYEMPDKKVARQAYFKQTETRMIGSVRDQRAVQRMIAEQLGYRGQLLFYDHHLSHAASAFYCSGFESAALFTVDGVGEWATTSYGFGDATGIDLFEEVQFPHSLGLLYATLTAYLGFRVNGGEYKVMGLAAYGEPRYLPQLRQLVQVKERGQFALDLRYFAFIEGDRMYSEALLALLGQPARQRESVITPFHCDVACSVQRLLEEVLIEKARYLRHRVDSRNLCMAGGVALNVVANAKIERMAGFDQLFVQPAAGDAGGAIGAALLATRELAGTQKARRIQHVNWGPRWSGEEIVSLLNSAEIPHQPFDPHALNAYVADRLVTGAVVAWFQGRMEFGPRALGARSIIANPLLPEMRERLNEQVKYRESFRPFAPCVLAQHATDHFDLTDDSPFMLKTCAVQSPLDLPAITHVDGTARPQTVDPASQPRLAALLTAFHARTGCPILLNTSFNLRGEPIVCTPADALLCFARSDIDLLVLENCVIERAELPANWREQARQWHAANAPTGYAIDERLYTFV